MLLLACSHLHHLEWWFHSRMYPMRAIGYRLHSFPFHSWMLVTITMITPPTSYALGCAKQFTVKVWLLKIPYNYQHLPWSPYSYQMITLIPSRALCSAITIDHMICWSNKPCTLNTHQCTWWLAWLTGTPQYSKSVTKLSTACNHFRKQYDRNTPNVCWDHHN